MYFFSLVMADTLLKYLLLVVIHRLQSIKWTQLYLSSVAHLLHVYFVCLYLNFSLVFKASESVSDI